MRKRAVHMILTTVTVVALLLGVPGAVAASIVAWHNDQAALEARAESLLRAVDRRLQVSTDVPISLIDVWATPFSKNQAEAHARVSISGGRVYAVGNEVNGRKLVAFTSSASGTAVHMEVSAQKSINKVIMVFGLFLGGMVMSLGVGWLMASRLARRLSAPLIYLAAQAEQIGSGQVRARVKPCGIEEIDLVQEELARTAERMAGRLAAERQFAADASHQLRTPLTALSMRLEEIEMISGEEEVRTEAASCLEQVERLTTVVTELLDASARTGGNTEAIHIIEILNAQREEWEDAFERAGRELIFTDEADLPVLADAPKLGQVLATLIENSLRYGAGTTRVVARRSANKRGVMIDVSDEGEGVAENLVADLFEYGVSGHGSSGIGLALARDLTSGMGGRLELAQNSPPIFTISLAAIPASLRPDRVMPEGPLVSTGRRSRRF